MNGKCWNRVRGWIRAVGVAAFAAALQSAVAATYYIKPDPCGLGDGSNWANATAVSNLTGMAAGDVYYLSAGTHAVTKSLSCSGALTLLGGYVGDDNQTEVLADDPVSVLDAKNSSSVGTILTVTAASGTFKAARIDFRRGYQRGLKVTGGINVELESCVFRQNAWNNYSQGITGRGAYFSGSSSTTVSLSECAFLTNVVRAGSAYLGCESGCSIYAETLKSLDIADTVFLRNGIDGSRTGRDKTQGGAFYVKNAPVHATRCKFLNMTGMTHSGGDGGTMLLTGSCGGSTFVNCLWSKCNAYGYQGTGSANGSSIWVSLGAKAQTVLFDRCTFAFNNFSGGSPRSGAVHLGCGTATVKNSIIWGNTSSSEYDFTVGSSGVLKLQNSIIGGVGSANVNVQTGGSFTPTDNILQDPLFATDTAMAKSLTADQIDFHVHSMVGRYLNGEWVQDADHSPAIDAATEDVDYSNEQSPNGGIANLGFYGGTEQASKSVTVVPTVTAVAVQNDYTRPSFDITLGGNTDYRAAVWLCFGKTASTGAGTNGWESVVAVGTAARGDTVTGKASTYYDTGDTLYFRAVLIRGGQFAATADGSVTLTNDPPPFRGKGGGENIIHVRADAIGNGTGTNWEHAVTTLAAAIKFLSSAKNEIWVAGTCPLGGTTSATRTFTLRGGFAGTECAASERTEDAVSILNGQGSSASPGLVIAASSGTFVAERIEFFNAYTHGLSLTGGASAALTNCCFRQNAWNNTGTKIQGRGAYFTGSSSASLTFAGCSFLTNVLKCSGSTGCESGCGLYAKTFRRITMDDTDFIWNGTCVSSSGRDSTKGAGIYIESAPVTARRCRFLGLWGMTHNAGADGGAMYLCGSCGGSAFTNCLWAGSSFKSYSGGACANAGALWLALSAKAQAVGFENCTFAANYAKGLSGGALMVTTGTANVRNSIFWGNFKASGQTSTAQDIYVGGSAVVNLDHCIQKQAGGDYTVTTTGGTLNLTSMITDDPLFADVPATADKMTARRPESMDFHVHSKGGRYLNGAWTIDEDHSPAIDRATDDADCSLEPDPDGGVANLGFYGGTVEASKSLPVSPEVASITVITNDYTCPSFDITLGGNGEYSASVYLCLGRTAGESSRTNGWEDVILVSELANNGETVRGKARIYYEKGETIHYQAILQRAGTVAADKGGSFLLDTENPPFRGKGGGEHVIHLREGAFGNGAGTNWEHAVTTLKDAMALLSDTKSEIWVSGTVSLGDAATATRVFTLRGGFVGTENDLSGRSAGTRAVLNGGGTESGLVVTASSGTFVAENIDFYNAYDHGISLTGGASAAFTNCCFRKNAWNNAGTKIQGRGAYFTGSSSATLTFAGCSFLTNIVQCSGATGCESGCGLYAKTFKRITMDDTDFIWNGVCVNSSGRDSTKGAGIYIEAAPVTARRCRFLGLYGLTHNAGADGGAMYMCGACGGSTFTNCLWAGNSFRNYQGVTANAGALWLALSAKTQSVGFERCTFAANYAYGSSGAALMVSTGTANIRNSIFWGNFKLSGYSASVQDIYVGGSAIVNLDHSIQKQSGGDYTVVATGGECNLTAMVTNSPLFADAPSTAAAMTARRPESMDFHLQSTVGRYENGAWVTDAEHSPAIDAATADADYALEPDPNGSIANLGFYGGTAEASKSVPAQPEVTEVVITEPDYTRPTFAVTLGGTGNYHAYVYLCLGHAVGEGTNGWEDVVLLSDYAANGETVTGRSPRYYAQGEAICWSVVTAVGETVGGTAGTREITGENPPFRGKGGGERIIHVREDVAGDGTGTNWEHAVATLADAMKLVTDEKTEIWVAGKCPLGTFDSPTQALTIRGGFTGVECSAAERPNGARATLDGEDASDGLHFGAADGVNRVERMRVVKCLKPGVKSTAGASLELVDCELSNNGREPAGMSGRGLYMSGNNGSTTLFVSNVVIAANRNRSSGNDDPNNLGQGAYLANLKRAYFYDAIVATNGAGLNASASRSSGAGAAIMTYSPLTMVRCRVLGHGSCCHISLWSNTAVGGIVCFEKGSGGSAITNCLFMGNTANAYAGTFSGNTHGSGAVLCYMNPAERLDIENCTFAYNLSHGATAGLYARGGTIRVGNSIFWGNLAPYGHADLYEYGTDSSMTLDHCLFAGTNSAYFNASGATWLHTKGLVIGNPLFVSGKDEFDAAITSGCYTEWPTLTSKATFASEAAACAFNVHLMARTGYTDELTGRFVKFDSSGSVSPAVDAGCKRARDEVRPNGGRLNLGCYGGTRFATRTPNPGFVLRISDAIPALITNKTEEVVTKIYDNYLVCDQADGAIKIYDSTRNLSSADALLWCWKASEDDGIPAAAKSKLATVTECKSVMNDTKILMTAGNGWALVDKATCRAVAYGTLEGNVHSAEMITDTLIAVVSTTGVQSVFLIDIADYPMTPASQPKYQATGFEEPHGLYWDSTLNRLWIAASSGLHCCTVGYAGGSFSFSVESTVECATIDDADFHDLRIIPNTRTLAISALNKLVYYDISTRSWLTDRSYAIYGVKGFDPSADGKVFLVTQPKTSWWTDEVSYLENNAIRTVNSLAGAKFYKVRWFPRDK